MRCPHCRKPIGKAVHLEDLINHPYCGTSPIPTGAFLTTDRFAVTCLRCIKRMEEAGFLRKRKKE